MYKWSYIERVSASASATYTGTIHTDNRATGVMAYLNITALPGSASTTWALKLQAIDPLAGGALTIGSCAARSASGVSALMLYPSISESSGALTKVNAVLPSNYRFIVSLSTGAANAGSSIFSLAVSLIP